jgi:hypothetical protein
LNTDFLVGIPVEVLLKTGTNRNRGVLSQFCTEKRLDENLVLFLLKRKPPCGKNNNRQTVNSYQQKGGC